MSRRGTGAAKPLSGSAVEPDQRRATRWTKSAFPQLAMVTLLVLSACSRAEVGPSDGGMLVVVEPADGSVVTTSVFVFRGTAPPGAKVVRDVSLGRDQSVEAGSDGGWALEVKLKEGENKLTFRLADDKSSAQVISVTYDPFTVAEPADGSEVATSTITVRGTAPAGGTVVRDIPFAPDESVDADAKGSWEMRVELDVGQNVLTFRLGDDKGTARTIRVLNTAAASPESTPGPTVAPTVASAEAQLRALVGESFKGETNWSSPTLRDVDIVPQLHGGWGVFVNFNANDNVTTGFVKRGVELDMIRAYKALYTADLDVTSATMAAWLPIVDTFGNEKVVLVYKTILEGDVAAKVNWDEANFLDWDKIWTVSILHPALLE